MCTESYYLFIDCAFILMMANFTINPLFIKDEYAISKQIRVALTNQVTNAKQVCV